MCKETATPWRSKALKVINYFRKMAWQPNIKDKDIFHLFVHGDPPQIDTFDIFVCVIWYWIFKVKLMQQWALKKLTHTCIFNPERLVIKEHNFHTCSFIIVLISGSVLSLTSYFCCFMVVLVHKSSNDFLGVKMIPKKDQKPDRQRRRQIDIALTEETKRGISHTWAPNFFEGGTQELRVVFQIKA